MKRLYNSQIKMIKSLQNVKGRSETGFFVAEGLKEVRELISSGIVIEMIVVDKNFDSSQIELKKGIELYEHNIESVTSMASSEGILAVARIPEPNKNEAFFRNRSRILGLFSISDPGNIGTLIRTARWFNLDGVILYGNCADIWSPKVLRSSMGAIFGIDFIKFSRFNDSREFLRNFYKISTYLHKINDYKCGSSKKKILFLGNEANGMDRTMEQEFDSNFRIGPEGGFESLNVSVAGGIIMNEIFNIQRGI
ncbi:TPA: hypothetical protein DCR49_03350 [Candidatus Delongbacteria bacterium]|nr:MAG: hypothetical protein A2Y39_06090 [Candidatus Delongbacteria bacterium GWF2_40_14]HAQ61023.1 hypothetical protein [Candidatus Delongbacteria bacterium]